MQEASLQQQGMDRVSSCQSTANKGQSQSSRAHSWLQDVQQTPENSSDATRLMTKQKHWVQSSAAKHVVMMTGQLDESATSKQQKHPNAMVAHLAACGLQDAVFPSFSSI